MAAAGDAIARTLRSMVRTLGPAVLNSRPGALVQRRAPELFYPRPQTNLAPERLYAYLDAIWHRRDLAGGIVEVGCFRGGTAALAYQLLRNTDHVKRYVCIDTFGGFVPTQFAHDERVHGLTPRERRGFSAVSRSSVARLLALYGCDAIELIEGDIVTLPPASLPGEIAVGLVDVDLEIPVFEALEKLYPRIVPGGAVLVDDCSESSHFPGARIGYERFIHERNLPATYRFGMGVVER